MILPRIRIEHPIRAFAVFLVALITGFLMWTCWWLVGILTSPAWCGKAIMAERITPGKTFAGLIACVDILKTQLLATANVAYIGFSSLSLSLIVLMVIVIAAGKLQVAGSKAGFSIGIGKAGEQLTATEAAQETAGAAKDKAEEIEKKTDGELPPMEPRP